MTRLSSNTSMKDDIVFIHEFPCPLFLFLNPLNLPHVLPSLILLLLDVLSPLVLVLLDVLSPLVFSHVVSSHLVVVHGRFSFSRSEAIALTSHLALPCPGPVTSDNRFRHFTAIIRSHDDTITQSLSSSLPTPLVSPESHQDIIITMFRKIHICSAITRIRMKEQCACILICLSFTLNLTLIMACMTGVFRTVTIHFKYEYH